MEIQIINNSNNPLPVYKTSGSAGMDLQANLEEAVTLSPREIVIIPTGLHIALPQGYEAQVRSRSGLAAKHGVAVVNSPGTIDSDYRGDIGVILTNHSSESIQIHPGDRIAQLVIAKHETVSWNPTDRLDETTRGSGGYGSTGR